MKIEDISVPYEIIEDSLTTLIDPQYPPIKDPLLGYVTGALPMDIRDLDLTLSGLPQAQMFRRYVTSILAKNISEDYNPYELINLLEQ